MTANIYIVIPKLFIRLNPVCHGQKMTPMPSAYYGFYHLCIIFTLQQLHITLIWLEKPFTSWLATTSSKFETQVAHLMYRESHIAEDPITSFICSASSFGNMRATSPTSATRTSTLNHVSRIGVKWNLYSPPKPPIVSVATFCL
jgi:hypothetical protein